MIEEEIGMTRDDSSEVYQSDDGGDSGGLT
jgi:hypothetical protein